MATPTNRQNMASSFCTRTLSKLSYTMTIKRTLVHIKNNGTSINSHGRLMLQSSSTNHLINHRLHQRSRSLHTGIMQHHGEYEMQDPRSSDEIVNVVFIDRDGNDHSIKGKIGDNVLYLAHRYSIEMEGACEASLACTTCHVYIDHEHFDHLPEAHEEEEDLLDLAPFLQVNSRLGCQIILTKQMDGMRITLPKATRNFYVDGHIPQPH